MSSPLLIAGSACTGFVLGVVFSLMRLPVPAPGNIAGAVGVVGVTLGYLAVKWAGWGG